MARTTEAEDLAGCGLDEDYVGMVVDGSMVMCSCQKVKMISARVAQRVGTCGVEDGADAMVASPVRFNNISSTKGLQREHH